MGARFVVIIPSLLFIRLVASQTVAIGDVPPCARQCLSNSTAFATDCAQIDVQCLCNSPHYVSALSCCLVKTCNDEEQQIAITFNVQECAAVNASAPNFIGCSPFSISAGGGSGSGSQQSTMISSTQNAEVSVITGAVVTDIASFTGQEAVTESFAGRSLLTGICSKPYFAQVTGRGGNILQFPQIGCAASRQQCCPFDAQENGLLTECPPDYFTTSSRCCPSGFQLFYTAVGASQTPCYSVPAQLLVPETTPTIDGLTLITNQVFSRAYTLAPSETSSISTGAIIGISVGGALFVLGAGAALFWVKRRRTSRGSNSQKRVNTSTFPPEEPHLASTVEVRSPQELASPERPVLTPTTAKTSVWPFGTPFSSPPAYDSTKSARASMKTAIPQELPGSTYLHEHHPAYTGSQTEISPMPRSPPRTPGRSETASIRSPVLSHATPLCTRSPGSDYFSHSPQLSPASLRPGGSPALSTSEGRRTPRFQEENIK